MNKMKRLAFAACAGLALAAMGGCATTQVAGVASADAAPARMEERMVLRALPSYGTMGGYRYRRFAAVAAAS
jgi:hypothetical protein